MTITRIVDVEHPDLASQIETCVDQLTSLVLAEHGRRNRPVTIQVTCDEDRPAAERVRGTLMDDVGLQDVGIEMARLPPDRRIRLLIDLG